MYSPEPLNTAFPIIKETVPQSALGYHTNNKYAAFPPLMSDGRSITASWQPESSINADLIQNNDIQSNWQYRKFLTDNAAQIMAYNFRESSNDVGFYKRPIDLPNMQSNQVSGLYQNPYMYASLADKSQPVGYMNSDLKDIYLSREQLDARKISPVVTQEQLLGRQTN
jgi:hypothetical protein